MKQRDRNDARRTAQLQPQRPVEPAFKRQSKSLQPMRVCVTGDSRASSPMAVSSPDSPACFSGQLLSRGSPPTPVAMPSLISHLYQSPQSINTLPSFSAFQSPPPNSPPPMTTSLFDLSVPHRGPTLLNDRSAWASVCGWTITLDDLPADTPSPVETATRSLASPAFTPVLDKSRVARLRQGAATRQRSNSADLFLDCVQLLSTKNEKSSTASPSLSAVENAMMLTDSEDLETSSHSKAALQHSLTFDTNHSQFLQRDVSMWH